jgi:hypothetical protein
MDTVENVEDIWYKAEQFMHQAGSYLQSGHIGKANDLYIFEPIVMSKVSCTYMCPLWWRPRGVVWPGMPFPNLDGRIHQSLVLFCVPMTSCANVELESELPRPSAS